jgi:hypothetical protein
MSAVKNAVGSFREVVQDLLVPELKSMKVSIDALRTEMKLREEKADESLRRLEDIIRLGGEKNEMAIRGLSEKLEFAIDIRERLALLEARLPRQ